MAEQAKSIFTIYLMLFFITFVTLNITPSVMKKRNESWFNLLFGFILTVFPLLIIQTIVPVISQAAIFIKPGAAVLPLGVVFAFTAAYIEENVFRDALPKFIGDILSSITFGFFHFAVLISAYGIDPISALFPMGTLMFLGLLWAKVRNQFGIMGSTGSHFGWNMFALGILPRMFGI